jgi:ribose-phosphate pyrophosphokinase
MAAPPASRVPLPQVAPAALFALGASAAFGTEVARRLGVELCAHEEREFEDGEHKARTLVSVRGRDVYVIHSLHGDSRQSPNDKLVRLLLFLGSLRDAAAARVTAVVPYLAYARKDRRSQPHDPVSTRYVASLFEAVGTDCIATLDVHNLAAFQNAFRCRAENLEAAGVLAAHVAGCVGAAPVSVVSPDAGGIKRADRFRECLAHALGRPVAAAFVEKYRAGGVLRGEQLVGEVDGRTAIIVDDIIASGATLERAADACRRQGAQRVLAASAHGLFTGNAGAVLGGGAIERVVVTDSIPPRSADGAEVAANVERVAIAPLFAEAIRRMHAEESLVELAIR